MKMEKLLTDLEVAMVRAREFADVDDDGTCNFDTPWLIIEGKVDIKAINELCGCYEVENNCYAVGYKILNGQAYRRTKMAEEFVDCLRRLGYMAYVHYRAD